MADYYPLIARAIAGLDPNAPGESRRALYERARAALIAQLRNVHPPLSESEITRERLSLEEAVRKVESEAAQRVRDASRAVAGGPSRASEAIRRASARGAEAAPAPPPPAGQQAPAPSPRPRPPASQPSLPPSSRTERPPLGQEERPDAQRAPRTARPEPPPAPPPRPQAPPPVPMQDPQLPPVRERAASPPSRRGADNGAPQAPGVRGFRDITADADDLGRAAAQANRAARRTYANVPSPAPELDRIEPDLQDRGGEADALYSHDESIEEAERYSPPTPRARVGGE